MNLDVKDVKLDFEFMNGIATNIEYNEQIESYYVMMANDLDHAIPRMRWKDGNGSGQLALLEKLRSTVGKKLDRLYDCQKKWVFDFYEQAGIKDFQRSNLCKDKFCNNCKKVKQASRLSRYKPHLDILTEYKKVHLILTVKNPKGRELRKTIKQMTRSFARLVEFLKGKEKIKGIDFSSWGYLGAIRSLEVTYKDDDYHPHFHVMLVMEPTFEIGNKTNVNLFSKFKGKIKNRFSDKEILIQKLWYLLLNPEYEGTRAKKITKARLDELTEGYSCMMEEFKDGHYEELFKYITKSNGSGNKDDKSPDNFLTYDQFKVLYFSLDGVHQIQGYGHLYNIQDIDVDEDMDLKYDQYLELLREKEEPRKTWESPRGIIENLANFQYISRKKYYSYLRELYQESKDTTTIDIVEQLQIEV